METMQWSEISTTSSSPISTRAVNGIGGNDQHHNPHHNHVPGGPSVASHGGSNNGIGGALGAPTIKNHSVTYFNNHLYCFGGYDGRRNHNLLLLYNTREHRWIRPQTVLEDEFNNTRNDVDSDGSNPSVTRANHHATVCTGNNIDRPLDTVFEATDGNESNTNGTGNENGEDNGDDSANDDSNDSAPERINESQEVRNRHELLPDRKTHV